jgi:hypothetical protein
MLGPRSRGSQLQGPAGPVQSGVDPAGRGGRLLFNKKKKTFFFGPAAAAASSQLRN